MSERLDYASSVALLKEHGFISADEILRLPAMMPSFDDDERNNGVSFYKTGVWDDELPDLTLPHTFIGRSEVSHISFRNTDFFESRMRWNDFIDVDFTEADLSRCDLRASVFREVKFVRANLSEADLRHSTFTDCDFAGARLRGAKLTHEQGQSLALSEAQHDEIDWQEDEGEEPEGG